MLQEYLTDKENRQFFTYDKINVHDNKYQINDLISLYIKYYSQIKQDNVFKELENLINKYYSSNTTKYYFKHSILQLFENSNNIQNISFPNEFNKFLVKSIYNTEFSTFKLKEHKYFLINNIENLKEETSKIVKTKIVSKTFKKKDLEFKKDLNFFSEHNLNYMKTILNNDSLTYKLNIDKQQIDSNIDKVKLLSLFLENMVHIKNLINFLIEKNQPFNSINFEELKVIKYTGSIFKIENYSKKQEPFYITANSKGIDGFIGLKKVHPRGYGQVFTPKVVQNIENASLFTEETMPDNVWGITFLDKVYISGDIKKVLPIEKNKEISSIGLTCQSMIDKSQITSILNQDSSLKDENEPTKEIVKVKKNKI